MKQFLLWLLAPVLISGCHNPTSPQDLPNLSWQSVDSVFTYYIEKDGDHVFKSGDLLGLEFIGGIDKKSHQFIPATQLDSTYAALVTKIAEGLLNKSLGNKIRKNSEGFIKADFFRLFPDQKVVITAYLKENPADSELDTLKKYIGVMSEISAQEYISKEEAKKQFIGAGNNDFTAVLGTNPLPASIQLTIKEDYCTMDSLTQLKNKLERMRPHIISEVSLPNRIFPQLRKVKTQDCVFHFKT